jgi:LacI family transcriptional regulator
MAGRLAAEHLLDCGLRDLAFFSFGNAWWIGAYREGFVQRLAEQGLSCGVFHAAQGQRVLLPRWNNRLRPTVAAWLHRLPKPSGIFCPSTGEGRCLLDLCRSEGLGVPEQVAVLAGADDPAICEVTTPSLSGIDFDSARIGYEAAALLDRLMSGREAPKEVVWIPPIRVVARQSTDVLAIADPDVAQAMRFIRERACRGIRVPDVVRDAGLSRRTLERRFQEHLGRSPKEEILRMRIDRAAVLLGQSEMSIEAVARSSGFASFKHFARVFRQETGVTPRTFRKTSRSAKPSL